MDRGSNAEARVLSTFLNEMDGVDGSLNDGVLVLGATNRPATLDSALLRPGRFDRVIYVPPPDEEGRKMIFQAQCDAWSKSAGRGDIDVDYLSRDQITGLMTGAEIVGACREAAMLAIRESFDTPVGSAHQTPKVFQRHLQKSLDAIKPLLSDPEILKEYTSFEEEHTK
jgi:transitional endoplasmic reticulum ATPase